MFDRFLNWIRRLFGMNTQDIKQALKIDIAMSADMVTALQKWVAMYENKADWLMNDIKSMGLPAAIAYEIARAVTIEMKVQIGGGSKRATYLQTQVDSFVPKLKQQYAEYGCAKGGLVMKPYPTLTGIAVDFVQ